MVYMWRSIPLERARRDLEVAEAIATIVEYVDDADQIKEVLRGICNQMAKEVKKQEKLTGEEYPKPEEAKE